MAETSSSRNEPDPNSGDDIFSAVFNWVTQGGVMPAQFSTRVMALGDHQQRSPQE